ncbi:MULTISPECIES: twin-arginine translocation signal domain-containing protein [Rhizobium]|uniref:Uncharacterized protein n=1 Tax=Rhizobium esperanzae TaxID=1967781 RepID=A0A7W6UH70_9HYPH|nr:MULTISPECIES: twin-arginine translocation signal domain-containing protein [Rhizobium]MBB4438148.1 hypothetical protein [Rhizobium esperanzae]MDH6200969.1 hypothetical protein [Rhizobium leguminosarum]
MTYSRRSFIKGLGALGAAGFSGSFIKSVAAQSLASIRPSFSNAFRLASSPLIQSNALPGIRLRWNYPLFETDGTYARCMPDHVIVHRRSVPLAGQFVIPSTDVGTDQIAAYPDYGWNLMEIVQLSSSPHVFAFRQTHNGSLTTAQGLTFVYDGDEAMLKLFGAGGQCLLVSAIRAGQRFYFDSAEINRFELDAAGGRSALLEARCLDLKLGNEIRLDHPVAKLQIREPLASRLNLEEGALRLNGRAGQGGTDTTLPPGEAFLEPHEWDELVALASELASESCSGAPTLETVDDMRIASSDLFLTAVASRWEMAPRLGFGFRDGPDPSTSHYDEILDPFLDLGLRDEAVLYQLEAVWSSGGSLRSNVASSRLDRAFDISKPQTVNYVATVNGKSDSDFISSSLITINSPISKDAQTEEISSATTVKWAHVEKQRTSGIAVFETVTSGNNRVSTTVDWLQHRGVYSEGYTGSVYRPVNVGAGDNVEVKAWSFDGWDRISEDFIAVAPRVVLNYQPTAPELACATYLASLQEKDGKVLIERLVTSPDFRPSTLPAIPAEDGSISEFAEWQPDKMMKSLISQGYLFRLEVYEAKERPAERKATIKAFAIDRFGGFVQFVESINLTDFIGGFLVAQNGRYAIRTVVGDRLYIGRFQSDAAASLDEATCNITTGTLNVDETDEPLAGMCTLTQNYDAEEFWEPVGSVAEIGGNPIDYTFLRQPLTPRPVDEPDNVDYRVRLIGERNTERLVGRFSNVVSAQRMPSRPDAPRGVRVRQLGYDYYDRLLICCELSADDQPGLYALQFAAGVLSAEVFSTIASSGTVFGSQEVGATRTLYEALPIGRNFQTGRRFTIGISRVNKAGTFGPAAVVAVDVPVE